MTAINRTTCKTSSAALVLFGLVYLAALSIVLFPELFRADAASLGGIGAPHGLNEKGTP